MNSTRAPESCRRVGELGIRPAEVERHLDAARRRDRAVQLDEGDRVERQHRDPVARRPCPAPRGHRPAAGTDRGTGRRSAGRRRRRSPPAPSPPARPVEGHGRTCASGPPLVAAHPAGAYRQAPDGRCRPQRRPPAQWAPASPRRRRGTSIARCNRATPSCRPARWWSCSRQLIRNRCVNDGTPDSGEEVRNADTLADYLAGAGLDVERFAPRPGRTSIVARIEGHDPGRTPRLPDGPHRRRAGQRGRLGRGPLRGRAHRRRAVGSRGGRHAEPHRLDGGGRPPPGVARPAAARAT